MSTYVLLFFLLCSGFSSSSMVRAQETSSGDKEGSSFTSKLINIEAPLNKPFRYNTTLYNGTSEPQTYDLTAKLPEGWNAVFNVRGNQVTSIKVDSDEKENITVELYAMYEAKPSEYEVSVTAAGKTESLQLDLEAVVKGAYEVELTTPSGRLSDEITEGNQKEIQLSVKNVASLPLKDIKISAQTPPKWDATFEPSEIDHLAPGATKTVTATVKVPNKTIVGDYVTTFKAKSINAKDEAAFRMTVVTSLLTGWAGVLVILITIALVYYLVRKYGRR